MGGEVWFKRVRSPLIRMIIWGWICCWLLAKHWFLAGLAMTVRGAKQLVERVRRLG